MDSSAYPRGRSGATWAPATGKRSAGREWSGQPQKGLAATVALSSGSKFARTHASGDNRNRWGIAARWLAPHSRVTSVRGRSTAMAPFARRPKPVVSEQPTAKGAVPPIPPCLAGAMSMRTATPRNRTASITDIRWRTIRAFAPATRRKRLAVSKLGDYFVSSRSSAR